ncbi:MAG TPA: hypothetical protein PKD52_11190 [Clostridiales bacterium]|nr:hypothetical protein [Clostridiales bacterium]
MAWLKQCDDGEISFDFRVLPGGKGAHPMRWAPFLIAGLMQFPIGCGMTKGQSARKGSSFSEAYHPVAQNLFARILYTVWSPAFAGLFYVHKDVGKSAVPGRCLRMERVRFYDGSGGASFSMDKRWGRKTRFPEDCAKKRKE